MKQITLVSNGDFRDSAGVVTWPKQEETLGLVEKAFNSIGVKTTLANGFDPIKNHGFITTQGAACKVFSQIDKNEPIVVVLSCWAWAHHVASSLKLHKGSILLLANFDGTWPGLVSLLNHSATFERLSILHSKIWSTQFSDDAQFIKNLKTWSDTGNIKYSTDHVTSLSELTLDPDVDNFGVELAKDIFLNKRILGQMDPGCMGMLNAVLDPEKMAAIGMPVELLNQSDLLAEMKFVEDSDAQKAFDWLESSGATFHWGTDEASELTRRQVFEQMKFYIAAGRIYDRYQLSAIGIPYQYGLVRCTSASDFPEGTLNNAERPEIRTLDGTVVNPDKAIVHFNEGDLGSAIPQVLMYDILSRKNMPAETTLHDVRWGDEWEGKFVWVFQISGGTAPAHFGGWKNTHIYRQLEAFFPQGGGTCSGVSIPGTVTWARFYDSFGEIGMDIGIGEVLELPEEEVNRRREATTKEWPIANTYIPGYGREEMMSTHKSNHITLCYGNILGELAATAKHLGIPINVIGDARQQLS